MTRALEDDHHYEGNRGGVRGRVLISLGYCIAYALMLFAYYEYITPLYGYAGFNWAPDGGRVFEGFCCTLAFPWILPSQNTKPSDIFLHMQLLFPILPMLVLYSVGGEPRAFLYATIGAYLLIDASQMIAHAPVSMKDRTKNDGDIDVLVFSGHKIYAPGSPGASNSP